LKFQVHGNISRINRQEQRRVKQCFLVESFECSSNPMVVSSLLFKSNVQYSFSNDGSSVGTNRFLLRCDRFSRHSSCACACVSSADHDESDDDDDDDDVWEQYAARVSRKLVGLSSRRIFSFCVCSMRDRFITERKWRNKTPLVLRRPIKLIYSNNREVISPSSSASLAAVNLLFLCVQTLIDM
jgi:hypothetical protein